MAHHDNPFEGQTALKVHFKQIGVRFTGIDERDSGISLEPLAVFTNRPNGDGNPVTIVMRDNRDGGFINVTAQYAKNWEKLEDAAYSVFTALYDALIGHGEIVYNRDTVLNRQTTGDIQWLVDDWRRNLVAATKGEGFCYDEDGDDFPCADVRDVMRNTEVFNFDVKLHVVPSVRHPSDISVGGYHGGSLQSFTAQVASSPNIFITESSVFSDAGDNNDEDSMENIAMLPAEVRSELADWMREDVLGR